MTRGPWSSVAAAMVCTLWGFVGGCGAGDADAGAIGPVVLGPHSTGGGSSDDGGQTNDGSVPSNDNGGSRDTTPDEDGNDSPGDQGDTGNINDNTGDVDEIDTCTAIGGRSFFAADGSLSFVEGTFIWTLGGVQEMGLFVCSGLDVVGEAGDGEVFTGRYNPQFDTIQWEGLVYRPERPWP